MKKEISSIFEIFRTGLGPSSSHTMGPFLSAGMFVSGLTVKPSLVRVILYGSLANTGKGHGTDKAIKKAVGDIPLKIVWDTETSPLPHPNTLRFEAFANDKKIKEWVVFSTGGGSISDENGPVGITENPGYPFNDISGAVSLSLRLGIPLWEIVENHETELWHKLGVIWETMRSSVERGIRSGREFIPGPLGLKSRAPQYFRQLSVLSGPQLDMAMLTSFSLAVSEENACGGEIVTAPTCGSCGVLPGLLYYFETARGIGRDQILKALATAGLFGAVIKANASISGAEVGCQGEIGSACSMASAACAQILGGTPEQIEYAAEMGMEHHLGLTCDPVEGYVQIPCIERNMFACLRAFECGSLAVITDGSHRIGFDDVIEVMYRTGLDLNIKYRETALGGLSCLWKEKFSSRAEFPDSDSGGPIQNGI